MAVIGLSRSRRRILDIALLIFSAVVFLTGEAGTDAHDAHLHQMLALVVCVGVSIHLIWQWRWIANTSKRFFGKLRGKTRFDYTVTTFLLTTFLATLGSGLAISSWLAEFPDQELVHLHHVMPKLFLLGLIVHVQRHWRWLLGLRASKAAVSGALDAVSNTEAN